VADEPDIETLRRYFGGLLAAELETGTRPKPLGECTAEDIVYIATELIASAGSPADAGKCAEDSWRPPRRVWSGPVEEFVTSTAAGIVR